MNKKEILDKISKLSKKGKKFESLVINRVLQRLDSEDFIIGEKIVCTADHKRLIYVLGDDPEISIEEGIEIIGEMAVANKKNLKGITLPNSLKKIERDAFMDCDALKSIHIPALVEEIDAYAFSDCDELKSVYFEEIPKTLHRKAFADCDKLHEISVPSEGVKAIRKALHVVDGDVDFLVVGREDPNKPAIDGHKKDSKKENDSEPSKVNKPTDKQKDSKAKNSPKPKDTGKITKEKESGNK
jgi:hypothetical protein